MQAHAPGGDQGVEGPAGALVELGVHQPPAGVHHGGLRAELLQPARCLEAQQASADHHAARGAAVAGPQLLHLGPDRRDVVEGAEDEGVLGAGDVQAGGGGAGGEHELVVAGDRPVGGGHGARRGVDLPRRHALAQVHPGVLPHGAPAQGQVDLPVRAGEGLGQLHAVVGHPRLVGEHGQAHVVVLRGKHRLRETVGGGSAADHDDVLRGTGREGGAGHGRPPGTVAGRASGTTLGGRDCPAVALPFRGLFAFLTVLPGVVSGV
ncbi:hypothetical protein BJF77_14190 [Kocuria sp. CNJ-770]|nr:hypothetical protein BJF77_14190 [Kocuria sp. CNJ-770]